MIFYEVRATPHRPVGGDNSVNKGNQIRLDLKLLFSGEEKD